MIRRLAVPLVVVALLVALDLWSKSAVFAWIAELPSTEPGRLVGDCHAGHARVLLAGRWFAFMLSYNPGMAWGFDGLPPDVLVLGRVAASVFLLVLLARTPGERRVLRGALTLILAGALGNLHDNLLTESRVGRPYGEVRDFIDVYFTAWDWHFPTFNVADSCITVGAVLLLLASFGHAGHEGPASDVGDGGDGNTGPERANS